MQVVLSCSGRRSQCGAKKLDGFTLHRCKRSGTDQLKQADKNELGKSYDIHHYVGTYLSRPILRSSALSFLCFMIHNSGLTGKCE